MRHSTTLKIHSINNTPKRLICQGQKRILTNFIYMQKAKGRVVFYAPSLPFNFSVLNFCFLSNEISIFLSFLLISEYLSKKRNKNAFFVEIHLRLGMCYVMI